MASLDMTAIENKDVVRSVWEALSQRRRDRIARFFAEGSEFTDVPSPADDVAHEPEQIVARLRLGLEKISAYQHDLR
jgi:hypothetical protein